MKKSIFQKYVQRINSDVPWLDYINSLLTDFTDQVKLSKSLRDVDKTIFCHKLGMAAEMDPSYNLVLTILLTGYRGGESDCEAPLIYYKAGRADKEHPQKSSGNVLFFVRLKPSVSECRFFDNIPEEIFFRIVYPGQLLDKQGSCSVY